MAASVARPTDVFAMHAALQDAVEEIISTRSSPARRAEALSTIECMLASACVPPDASGAPARDAFLALQDTFECNVPSRLLPWLAAATPQLETLLKEHAEKDRPTPEAITLSDQLHQALSLIQGIALIHPSSKRFLGRPYSLQTLLHLLLVSRHLSSEPQSKPSDTPSRSPSDVYLCATILDTFLCVLVDSPPALRAFEDVGGVQVAVRLLKRAGTPREVRMKSLEFLYFYLIDEKSGDLLLGGPDENAATTTPSTKRLEPSRPLGRSQTFANISSEKPDKSSQSIKPSRSAYLPSTPKPDAPSNTSTNESPPITPTVMVTSPSIPSVHASPPSTPRFVPSTPRPIPTASSSRAGLGHSRSRSLASVTKPRSSSSSSESGHSIFTAGSPTSSSPSTSTASSPPGEVPPLQPKNLLLLKREVEYTPLSPAKPPGPGYGKPGINGSAPRLPGGTATPARRTNTSSSSPPSTPKPSHSRGLSDCKTPLPLRSSTGYNRVRSTEEKKAILGDMLGNVDQLVEGVRKAGIWGLPLRST